MPISNYLSRHDAIRDAQTIFEISTIPMHIDRTVEQSADADDGTLSFDHDGRLTSGTAQCIHR